MALICLRCRQSGSSHLATHCPNPECRVNGVAPELKMVSSSTHRINPAAPMQPTPTKETPTEFTIAPLDSTRAPLDVPNMLERRPPR